MAVWKVKSGTEGAAAAEGASSSGKKSSAKSSSDSTYAMKFLVPEPMAAAIIGRKGAVIAEMRQSSNARITLTEHGEFYPHTECRIMTTLAASVDAIEEVIRQLLAKLGDLQSNASAMEYITQDGELRVRTLMPRSAVGGLIGKGGASIKQLRESSGAKITISDVNGSGPSAEQTVGVSGSLEAMESVLFEVNRQIQQLYNESWFQGWATTSGGQYATSYSAPSMPVPMVPGMGGMGGMGQIGAGAHGYNPQGINIMMQVAQSLPPYVMEDARGFALSCVVPNRLVGGLIGRGGSGTKEVQQFTNTKISIRDIPDDTENRAMHIAGKLSNTCAAYMMMMKRYLDAEQKANAPGGPPPR